MGGGAERCGVMRLRSRCSATPQQPTPRGGASDHSTSYHLLPPTTTYHHPPPAPPTLLPFSLPSTPPLSFTAAQPGSAFGWPPSICSSSLMLPVQSPTPQSQFSPPPPASTPVPVPIPPAQLSSSISPSNPISAPAPTPSPASASPSPSLPPLLSSLSALLSAELRSSCDDFALLVEVNDTATTHSVRLSQHAALLTTAVKTLQATGESLSPFLSSISALEVALQQLEGVVAQLDQHTHSMGQTQHTNTHTHHLPTLHCTASSTPLLCLSSFPSSVQHSGSVQGFVSVRWGLSLAVLYHSRTVHR